MGSTIGITQKKQIFVVGLKTIFFFSIHNYIALIAMISLKSKKKQKKTASRKGGRNANV